MLYVMSLKHCAGWASVLLFLYYMVQAKLLPGGRRNCFSFFLNVPDLLNSVSTCLRSHLLLTWMWPCVLHTSGGFCPGVFERDDELFEALTQVEFDDYSRLCVLHLASWIVTHTGTLKLLTNLENKLSVSMSLISLIN